MSTEVDTILREQYGWSNLEGAEPFAVEKALETMLPKSIAYTLDAWCKQFDGLGNYGYLQARWDCFNTDVKYWRLNTLKALGLVTEEEPEHIEKARSISEWHANMALGFGRTGFKDGGACSREDYAKRLVAASRTPKEWRNKELQYYTLVLAGSIPIGLHGFETMYVQSVNVDSIPEDPNKWFENVNTPQGGHMPWKANGEPNPKPVVIKGK